jgi:hypothetical protein
MPSDPALVRAVMRRWEIADYIAPEDLARMAVQAVLKEQEASRDHELVRVSKELLERLFEQGSEPVVVVGLERREDGTCDMILRTVDVAERIAAWLQHVERLGEIPGARAAMPEHNPLWDAAEAIRREFGPGVRSGPSASGGGEHA